MTNVSIIDTDIDTENAYTDEVGGYHIDGIGIAPNGETCGECSFGNCANCPIWAKCSE